MIFTLHPPALELKWVTKTGNQLIRYGLFGGRFPPEKPAHHSTGTIVQRVG
jgi:hypothetical protein